MFVCLFRQKSSLQCKDEVIYFQTFMPRLEILSICLLTCYHNDTLSTPLRGGGRIMLQNC